MRLLSFRSMIAVFSLLELSSANAQLRGHVQPEAIAARSAADPAGLPMQSPILGFAWTREPATHEPSTRASVGLHGDLRAIVGVPGASNLSDRIALPRGITNVYFAPLQQYALVERSGAALGLILLQGAGAGNPSALPSHIVRPDIVAFSPSAGSAAAYSVSERRVELLTGLPNAPQVATQFSASELPSDVSKMALADDGQTVLAASSDGRVYSLAAGRAPQTVFSAGDVGALAFTPASSNAVVYDRSGGKLNMIASVSGTPAARVLADGLAITGATLLQVNARTVVIAGAQSNHLWTIDLATSSVSTVQTGAPITMLQPLKSSGRFLLSAESGQPAWLLDSSGRNAVYFVPAHTAGKQ